MQVVKADELSVSLGTRDWTWFSERGFSTLVVAAINSNRAGAIIAMVCIFSCNHDRRMLSGYLLLAGTTLDCNTSDIVSCLFVLSCSAWNAGGN